MLFNSLESEGELAEIFNHSKLKPVVIFKHSTRCSISSSALDRFQRAANNADTSVATFYLLDLVRYRSVSNAIADELGVPHESPQVIVVKNGTSIYDASHWDISLPEVLTQAQTATTA